MWHQPTLQTSAPLFQIEYWHIDYRAPTEPAQKQSTGELIQGVGYYTHNTN